jgi:hypothetical protein
VTRRRREEPGLLVSLWRARNKSIAIFHCCVVLGSCGKVRDLYKRTGYFSAPGTTHHRVCLTFRFLDVATTTPLRHDGRTNLELSLIMSYDTCRVITTSSSRSMATPTSPRHGTNHLTHTMYY